MVFMPCFCEKAFLRNLGITKPIYVIPNGISSDEASRISKSSKLENPYDNKFINLVWVGRIREDKNVLGIVKSLLFVDEKIRSKIKIHIVGNGIKKYINLVKKEVVTSGLENNIIFHGPKFKEEKYQFIINSNIYLQPSFSEGISFSILDAMACSKPMILSRQTNMTYYYNEGFYKMTEPFPEDIAQSIIELVSNEKLTKELGENARHMIKTVFNWESLIAEYSQMYKSIISKLVVYYHFSN